MDLGYTVLPQLAEFIDVVLNVEKSVEPPDIPNEAGQVVTFTLVTTTEDYPVQGVDIIDTLPTPWAYIDNSTTITYPNGTVVTGDPADPIITGQILTWDLNLDMNPDETLVIRFSAVATAPPGGVTINQATATGTSNGQTYTSQDSATINISPSPTAIRLVLLEQQAINSPALILAIGTLLFIVFGSLMLFRASKSRS